MTGNSGYFVLGGSRDCSIKGVVPAVLIIISCEFVVFNGKDL